jgi:hypothetical protein
MAVIVVLALTGFSTGRGHGGSGSGGTRSGGGSDGGSGGGGCSSSSQDHDTSYSSSGGSSSGLGKSYDYDDNDYDDNDDGYDDDGYDDSSTGDTGSGSGAEQLESASVRLVKCATVKEPYATVEVTNPNPSDAAFWVDVSFKDRNGVTVKDETWKIDVPADDKVTVDIEMGRKSMVAALDHCVAEPEAEPTG